MRRQNNTNLLQYSDLSYIEKQNIGQQYIDTEFIPNQDTRVVCEFTISEYSTLLQNGSVSNARGATIPFGTRYSDLNRQFLIFIPIFNKTSGSFRFANQYYDFSDSSIKGTTYKLDANKNNWTLYKDNVLTVSCTFNYLSFTAPLSILLCNCNAHSTYTGINDSALYGDENDCKTIIYNCKIYDNGTLVRDFVPKLRNSDQKPGMYDLCESTCSLTGTPFYINAGTGEFLYA